MSIAGFNVICAVTNFKGDKSRKSGSPLDEVQLLPELQKMSCAFTLSQFTALRLSKFDLPSTHSTKLRLHSNQARAGSASIG